MAACLSNCQWRPGWAPAFLNDFRRLRLIRILRLHLKDQRQRPAAPWSRRGTCPPCPRRMQGGGGAASCRGHAGGGGCPPAHTGSRRWGWGVIWDSRNRAPRLWDLNILGCQCMIPPLLHHDHESPDTETLMLVHGSRRKSPTLCDNFNLPSGPFYISKGAVRVKR